MATTPPGPLDLESNGGSVIAAAVTTVSIAAIFVGLRFITRWTVARALGLSDGAILVALVFSVGNSITTILQVTIGVTGKHFTTALTEGPDPFVNGAKVGYATTLCYIVSLVTVKVSILLLYLRILSPTTIHRLCCAALALVCILGIYSLISNILICVPVAAVWDPLGHPDAWCFPGPPKWWSDLAIHIFTEVVILILPTRFIYSLNVPRGQKLGLYMLFAFGTIVCVVSLLRVPSLVAISRSTDPTWDTSTVAIWSCVELNIAIICACCMTLRPLLARLFPKLLTSGYQRHSNDAIPDPGQFPLTVGSRKVQRAEDPYSLENIDRMPESPPKTASRTDSTAEIAVEWSSQFAEASRR